MAQVTLIMQPTDGIGSRTGDYLLQLLQSSPGYDLVRIAVAFATSSGVARLAQGFRDFRHGGGAIRVSVGVDHQGTTQEALQLLLNLTDRTYVFHNPGPDTFHPKLYLFERPTDATLVMGSSNLTCGGLWTNFEANVLVRLDLSDPRDAETHTALGQFLDSLMDPASGSATLLDADLLAQLVEARWVVTETTSGPTARTVPRAAMASALAQVFRRVPTPRPPSVDPSLLPAAVTVPPPAITAATTFAMVLDNRDTRQLKGYSREIFIPLGARSENRGFWGWPHQFTTGATGAKERRVGLLANLVSGQTVSLPHRRLWDYPGKTEFRLNCGPLIGGATAGDLLVLHVSLPGASYDYEATVIKASSPLYLPYRRVCTHLAPGRSKKFWGFV